MSDSTNKPDFLKNQDSKKATDGKDTSSGPSKSPFAKKDEDFGGKDEDFGGKAGSKDVDKNPFGKSNSSPKNNASSKNGDDSDNDSAPKKDSDNPKSENPKSEKSDKSDSPFGEGSSDGAGKIGGGGLINLLSDIMPMLAKMMGGAGDTVGGQPVRALPAPGEDPADALSLLSDGDLDGDDPTIQHFKKDGGMGGVVKVIKIDGPEALGKIGDQIETLAAVRSSYRLSAMRHIFSALHNAHRGQDVAQNQVVACDALDRLILDTTDADERRNLVRAQEAVLHGTRTAFDAASFRVRTAFSAQVPAEQRSSLAAQRDPRVRLAYTTLNTQAGEGYQLCPKAQAQIGHAIPMELSKCRDNCIDSRVTRDGKVTCAYAGWLKKVADNNDAAMDRIETHRNPANAADLMTLAAGKRSNPAHDKEWETGATEYRLNHDYKVETPRKEGDLAGDNTEARLRNPKNGLVPSTGDGPKRIQDIPGRSMDQSANKKMLAAQSTAGSHRGKAIDPEKEDGLGRQIEDGTEGEIPTDETEQRLDKKGLYGHQGDPKERPQDILNKKASKFAVADKPAVAGKSSGLWHHTGKVPTIDAESEKTLGEQIEGGHEDFDGDESYEKMLDEAREPFDDDELDNLVDTLEQMLASERKDN